MRKNKVYLADVFRNSFKASSQTCSQPLRAPQSVVFFLLQQAHIALALHNKTLKTGFSFTTHWLALIAFHIISTPAESPAAPVHPGMQQYRKEGVLHLKSLLHAWVHSWPGYQKTVDYHFGSLKPTWHQTLSYAYPLTEGPTQPTGFSTKSKTAVKTSTATSF